MEGVILGTTGTVVILARTVTRNQSNEICEHNKMAPTPAKALTMMDVTLAMRRRFNAKKHRLLAALI